MKCRSWLKVGLNIIKMLIILILVVFLLHSNSNNRQLNRTENFNFNKTLGLKAMAKKDEEEKPQPVLEDVVINTYHGDLTGYAADCPLCYGTLACKTSYKVYRNGVVTYPDKEFGNVRIVASSKLLACGSIVKFNLKTISNEPVYAIVLDRGVLGRSLDLLMATEKDAYNLVGRKNITYEVLRNGW